MSELQPDVPTDVDGDEGHQEIQNEVVAVQNPALLEAIRKAAAELAKSKEAK